MGLEWHGVMRAAAGTLFGLRSLQEHAPYDTNPVLITFDPPECCLHSRHTSDPRLDNTLFSCIVTLF